MYQSTSRTGPSSGPILLDASTFDGTPFTISIPSLHAVGSGATAKIFTGQVVGRDGPLLVAVKVFGNMLEDHHQEVLIRELQAARQVSLRGHPSILPFIGSASFGFQTAIVSHYMRNGNLLEYLRTHDRVDKKKLILQVAEAVTHLHTVELLVHGDLKCANVLVSDWGDALLADFGLSTFVEKTQTSATTAMNVRQMYTVRFAAPEILRDVAGHPFRVRSKTRESDVYAFGMLVLEAITERPPWAGRENFAVMHSVCAGHQPSRPGTGFSQAWWEVCRSCWTLRPENRPAIQSVMNTLKVHQHDPDTADSPADFPGWTDRFHFRPSPPIRPDALNQEVSMPPDFQEHHEDTHEIPPPALTLTVLEKRPPSFQLPFIDDTTPSLNADTQARNPLLADTPPPKPVWRTRTPRRRGPPAAAEDNATWTNWAPNPRWMPSPEPKMQLLPEVDAPWLVGPRPLVTAATTQDNATWGTWAPNPRWMPSPEPITMPLIPDDPAPGLFGPRPLVAAAAQDNATSNPRWLSSPEPETMPPIPDGPAPGLFGPRPL